MAILGETKQLSNGSQTLHVCGSTLLVVLVEKQQGGCNRVILVLLLTKHLHRYYNPRFEKLD